MAPHTIEQIVDRFPDFPLEKFSPGKIFLESRNTRLLVHGAGGRFRSRERYVVKGITPQERLVVSRVEPGSLGLVLIQESDSLRNPYKLWTSEVEFGVEDSEIVIYRIAKRRKMVKSMTMDLKMFNPYQFFLELTLVLSGASGIPSVSVMDPQSYDGYNKHQRRELYATLKKTGFEKARDRYVRPAHQPQ